MPTLPRNNERLCLPGNGEHTVNAVNNDIVQACKHTRFAGFAEAGEFRQTSLDTFLVLYEYRISMTSPQAMGVSE